jgi:hypothetical protein
MRHSALGGLGLVISMASMSKAAPDAPRLWKITPPPGWLDISSEMKQQQAVRELQAQLRTLGHRLDVDGYQSPNGDVLEVRYSVAEQRSTTPSSDFLVWEDELRRASAQIAPEVSYQRSVSGKDMITDSVARLGDQTLYMRRIVGFDMSMRLVGVGATCRGPEAICLAATRSLTFDQAALGVIPPDARPMHGPQPTEDSDAYKQGSRIGLAILAAGFAAWLWLYVVRKRNR